MKKILALIDCQKDFIDGTMGVGLEKWNPAKASILELMEKENYDSFIITQDWHPANHCSFNAEGGPWPSHCVAMTEGAYVDEDLINAISKDKVVCIKKGKDEKVEEYGVNLGDFDEDTEIHVVGLCYDYCVASCAKMTAEANPKAKVIVKKAGTVAIDPTATPDFGGASVE